MARAKRRMTAADFDTVRALLKNISQERGDAARAALVDGDTLAVIAARHSCSRQAVNEVVGTFWDALTRYQEAQRTAENQGLLLPPGWEKITMIAPSYLIEKWRAELAAAGTATPAEQNRTDGPKKTRSR